MKTGSMKRELKQEQELGHKWNLLKELRPVHFLLSTNPRSQDREA